MTDSDDEFLQAQREALGFPVERRSAPRTVTERLAQRPVTERLAQRPVTESVLHHSAPFDAPYGETAQLKNEVLQLKAKIERLEKELSDTSWERNPGQGMT